MSGGRDKLSIRERKALVSWVKGEVKKKRELRGGWAAESEGKPSEPPGEKKWRLLSELKVLGFQGQVT